MALKLDLSDKKLLYELDRDSRQSNKQLAKKVGLSEQVVGNRIRSLIEKKVIDYFYVKTNPMALGYFHIRIFLRLYNLNQEKQNQLVQELTIKPGIFWLATLRGKYDLAVSLYLKSIAEFSQKYQELFQQWEPYILDRKIIFLEKAYTYNQSHLWPQQKHQEIIYTKGSEEKMELDETEIKILKVLNQDGRKPLIDIAQQINTSADTVNYRIRNLEKKGLITGFGTKINFSPMGNNYSIIFLKMQNMNSEKYLKLETWAKFNQKVVVLIKTLGDHEVEIELITSNREELDQDLKSLRDEFVSEIKDYEILEVIEEVRISYFPF